MHPTFDNWAELYEYADEKSLSVIIKHKNQKSRLTNYVRVNEETFRDTSETNRTIIDIDDTSEYFVHVWSKRTASSNEGPQQQFPLYTAISKNDVWSTCMERPFTMIGSNDPRLLCALEEIHAHPGEHADSQPEGANANPRSPERRELFDILQTTEDPAETNSVNAVSMMRSLPTASALIRKWARLWPGLRT